MMDKDLGKYMRARRKRDSTADYKIVKVWDIIDRDSVSLGDVHWYDPWQQYVFAPKAGCIFSGPCLTELRTFLSAETAKQLFPKVIYDSEDADVAMLPAEVRRLGLTGEGEGNY